MLYLVLPSMLIGSLASAEERQLGTLEWQVLLPIAAWKGWLVKTGTVFTLAFAFGIGLPLMLIYLEPGGARYRGAFDMWRQTSLTIVLLTTASLYVSTLSTSGLKALVASFPAVFAAGVLARSTMRFVGWTLSRLVLDPGPRLSAGGSRMLSAAAYELILLALAGGLITVLLVLGFRNHRSGDRGHGRVVRQVAWIAACLAAAVAVWAGVLIWSYSG
jgi:hypothetical protein